MKKLGLVLGVGVVVAFLALSMYTGGANACLGRWACGERPIQVINASQVCINQQAFTVTPGTLTNLYLHVPTDATVTSDLTSCNGTLQAMSASGVNKDYKQRIVLAGGLTTPGARVAFDFNGQNVNLTSDLFGLVMWIFQMP